jgi:hypothetical protein
MMDRFNFYDIYGFVLPGTLLIGIFWLPFGLATASLPSSEISSTLLLLVLAYIAGHLLQMFAEVVVPSRVRDPQGDLRDRSSLVLDPNNHVFSNGFKEHLSGQIEAAFNVQIFDEEDEKALGDEKNLKIGGDVKDAKLTIDDKEANRRSAFFQARTYLLQNKSTGYVEQFEGLYAMMRGFGCAFFVGCAYLVGWGLSFHWSVQMMPQLIWWLLTFSIAGALIATWFTNHYENPAPPAKKTHAEKAKPDKLQANVAHETEQQALEAKKKRDELEAKKKDSYKWVSIFLLFFACGLGYFLGTWKPAGSQIEFFLWAVLPVALIAGIRCLHAYAGYAENFAETVWRDFSASYTPDQTSKPDPKKPAPGKHDDKHADAPGGATQHAPGGAGAHGHPAAPKPAPEPAHGGAHGGHAHGH